MSKWFDISMSAGGDGPTQAYIYDEIGGWGVHAMDLVDQLRAVKGPIDLHIHSPGGSLYEGVALYNYLRSIKDRLTTYADGLVASAATLPFLAADDRRVPASAMIMVHEPSAMVRGTSKDLRRAAEDIDKHAEMVYDIYEQRTVCGREQLREMCAETTYIGSLDAVALGFATAITDGDVKACAEGWREQLPGAPDELRFADETGVEMIEEVAEQAVDEQAEERAAANTGIDDPDERRKAIAEFKSLLEGGEISAEELYVYVSKRADHFEGEAQAALKRAAELEAKLEQAKAEECDKTARDAVIAGVIRPAAKGLWSAGLAGGWTAEQVKQALDMQPDRVSMAGAVTEWEDSVPQATEVDPHQREIERIALYRAKMDRVRMQLAREGRAVTPQDIADVQAQVDDECPPIEGGE